MVRMIKGTKSLPKEKDCGCGKTIKRTDKKKLVYKKKIKRRK